MPCLLRRALPDWLCPWLRCAVLRAADGAGRQDGRVAGVHGPCGCALPTIRIHLCCPTADGTPSLQYLQTMRSVFNHLSPQVGRQAVVHVWVACRLFPACAGMRVETSAALLTLGYSRHAPMFRLLPNPLCCWRTPACLPARLPACPPAARGAPPAAALPAAHGAGAAPGCGSLHGG